MESNQHTTVKSDEEIDLFELLVRFMSVIKNNLVVIIASLIIGNLLGLAYYKFSPSVFQSEMLISSDVLPESYAKSLADNLLKLIKEKNTQSLSSKLSITPEQASMIAGIEIKIDTPPDDMSPETPQIIFLNIGVKTIDNSIWPQLEKGILDYLENNEFAKVKVEQKRKFNNQIIEKINLELSDLEKLKTQISQGGTNVAQSTKENIILFDPTTVNLKIIDFNKEKLRLQNELETINSAQIVEGFTIFNKPASPKLSLSLVGGSVFGLLFVIIFIVLKALGSVLKVSKERA